MTPQYRELQAAEAKAAALFDEVVRRGMIVPGKSEKQLSDEVFELAKELYGVRRYWHKRIVRAGKNTACVYAANPPELAIADDDVVFFDFGPVFGEWEADYGRTYVVGDDAKKRKLAADVEEAWALGAAWFAAHPDATCGQMYEVATTLAAKRGWTFGHTHSGHMVGRFPHEKIEGDTEERYLRAGNGTLMRGTGVKGDPLYWILEIHFVDPVAGYGGFQEGILPP